MALIPAGEVAAHEGTLSHFRTSVDTEGTSDIFRGKPEDFKRYYSYLVWRQRYMRQNAPFVVNLPWGEVNPLLKRISVLDDQWVRILVSSIGRSSSYVVLTKGSDGIGGVFKPYDSIWKAVGGPNESAYGYSSMVDPVIRTTTYRLYSFAYNDNEVAEVAEGSSLLSFYSVGHIKYSSPLAIFTSNGFLLGKDRRLIQRPGFFHYLSASGNVSCNVYDYDPEAGAMAIFSLGGYLPVGGDPASAAFHHMEYLVGMAGGYDRINREIAVFVPHESAEGDIMTTQQAKALLPWLYLLQEDLEDGPGERAREGAAVDPAALTAVIEAAEQALLEETYAKVKVVVEAEVEREMREAADQAASAALATEESAAATAAAQGAQASEVESKKEEHPKEKKKKKAGPSAPAPKPPALDPEAVKARGRVKVLEKIRANFLAKAAAKRHLKTSEAGELLGQLRIALSRASIQQAGEAHARGSHIAMAVTAAGGGSYYLGLVRRSEKEGFSGGTLRTE